jgi:class 3 adenylate cyclase/tetratricopeptide (TPR) repeat protein
MRVRNDGHELASARVRKIVTIVFADVVGSTELGERLDPESLQAVMSRYGAAMRQVIELHGGRVEKFIGDAVMGVFGIPVLHEDDALRAVRAGLGMSDCLAELNREFDREYGVELGIRIGVHTGEVITDELASDQALVAGDVVNAAARLQASAPTGAVLIGRETHRLVARLVRVRRHGDLELRGKTGRMRTWRVEALAPGRASLPDAVERGIVGRRRELRSLHERFDRCVDTERCVVTTVVGPAGIGKSHLVRYFAAEVKEGARVVLGRCLPYGDGITYWPLKDIVDQLGGSAALPQLLADDEYRDLAAAIVSGAVGQSRPTASEQDVRWATRRLLESLARSRPVVVVFDDIQWAEPALLELIEYLAGYVTEAPVMVICVARHDLLERRPSWASSFGRGATVRLRPLSQADSARLLRGLDDRRWRPRREEILAAAEGNPLFLTHLVAMRADDPAGATPPSIQALLAARVDALPVGPRRVIEAAAVEGRQFHRGVVSALLADLVEFDVDAALVELEQRELVRRGASAFPGERGYRFTHILVRDAAYELIPKRRRAQLHVGFAEWLRAAAPSDREPDEIIGYHLEQAYGYRQQLGRVDAAPHRLLAADASGYLTAAGRRALRSGDHSGAASLLRRAAALRAAEDPARTALLIDLGGVLREEGQFAAAEDALAEALTLANGRNDAALESRARLERLLTRLQVDPDGVARLTSRHSKGIEQALAEAGDHAGLARLWHLRALLSWIRAQAGDAAACWRNAADEAQQAGDDRILADALGWEASALTHGPTPVAEGLDRCTEILAQLGGNPWAEALAQHQVAGLHGMRGEFGQAFTLIDQANSVLAGFSPTVDGAVSHPEVLVSMLAGDAARAETHLRAGRRVLTAMGERAVLASTEALLGMAVLAQGRADEADRLALRAARLVTEDDLSPQSLWRRIRALVLAGRGRFGDAERLADEAVELAARTDYLNEHAGALQDLGHVHALAGRRRDAQRARAHALALYQRKGNVVSAVGLERAAAGDTAFQSRGPSGR